MSTDNRKSLILDALQAFVRQRPGFDPRNYGDRANYMGDVRPVTRQLRDAETLLAALKWRDSITADDLLKAATSAFSGRLTLAWTSVCKVCHRDPTLQHNHAPRVVIDYCTGQYFPTEFRAAVRAVLASALWAHAREHCMPSVYGYRVESWYQLGKGRTLHTVVANREAAELQLKDHGGSDYGSVCELYPIGKDYGGAGEWLRAYFRREFGRGIQSRWFS